MDPVQQTLAQQSSGSAEGQGFGSFYSQGVQFGLAKQRLAIEQAQEAREQDKYNLLRPYIDQNAHSEATILGAHAADATWKSKITAESNVMLQDINELNYKFMNSPLGTKDPALREELRSLQSRHPLAFAPGAPGDALFKQVQSGVVSDQKWQDLLQREQDIKDRGLNLIYKGDNAHGFPEVGADTSDLRVQDQQLRANAQRLTAIGQQLRSYGLTDTQTKLIMDGVKEGFQITGLPDPNGAFSLPNGQQQGIIPIAPTGTAPTVQPVAPPQIAPIARQSTTGTVTDLQKRSVETDLALRKLDSALEVLDKVPEAFGPEGLLRATGERLQGIRDPNAPTKITDAREKAGLAFTQVAKSLRTDSGNMSRYELSKLEGLGDVVKWDTPANIGKAMFRNIYDAAVAQRLRYAKALNQPVDDSLLARVSQNELPNLFKDNLLTTKDLVQWHKLHQQQ